MLLQFCRYSLKSLSLFFVLFCSTLYAENNPKMILIGAGGKKAKEYFALLKDQAQFVGFIQPHPKEDLIALASEENINIYPDLQSLPHQIEFDGALIVIPHYLHYSYTKKLLEQHKFVIKEKPISMTLEEAHRYNMQDNQIPSLFTIVQRQFQSSFIEAKKELASLGKIYSFKYEYNLRLKDDTKGWRAQKALSGGGALIDMGYHVIDMITSYFGKPMHVQAQFAHKVITQDRLDDEDFILFSYPHDVAGIAIISRYGSEKKECFEIAGEHGIITITPRSYKVYDAQGNLIKQYESPCTKEEELLEMFKTYLNHINDQQYIEKELNRHLLNIELIEKIYNA
jgi:predicted dehydrogenase